MKKQLVLVRNLIIIFVSAIIIGSLLNIVAAILPTGRIHNNVIKASSVFGKEGIDPRSITENDSTLLDNNTDAWMLIIADYNGEGIIHDRVYDGISLLDRSETGIKSFFSRAFDGAAYFYNDTANTGMVGLDNIAHVAEPEPDTVWLYPRYWHGWMLPLKMLLMLFTYSEIRLLLLITHGFLILGIIMAFRRRNMILEGIAFVAAIISMFPSTYMINFDYSMCTFVMELSVFVLVEFNEWFDKKYGRYVMLFLFIGILTTYFDFLTYPTITLTYPLIIWAINTVDKAKREGGSIKIKGVIIEFILCGLLWAIGYFGMWASKWVVCTIFTDPNMISDVLDQIGFRTSDTANGAEITIGAVLEKNFAKYNQLPLEIMGTIVLIVSVLIGKWKKPDKIQITGALFLVIIAVVPVVWLMVLSNHAFIHDHFTYRNLSGLFLAIVIAVQVLKGYRFNGSRIQSKK